MYTTDVGPRDAEQRFLVDAARAGDADAWEMLYRAVYARLRAYVARHASAGDVEDLVSETMTRAVAGIDRFRWEPAGFDAWLFGIARRVTADHHRRGFRAAAGLRRLPAGTDQFAVVGEDVEREEDHAEMRSALAALSDRDREILELRVIAGLSADQVAAVLGSSPGAIRTAQSRALGRLRHAMEQHSV